MEVVQSMSTESCIQTIRRFASRRSSPAEFFTDNGTNFQRANNQLRKEIEERNHRLVAVFTNFNGPNIVRSVKAAIKWTLPRKPDDQTLESVIIQAEGRYDQHTSVPLDSADQEALPD